MSPATMGLPAAVAAYLADLERELADLAPEEREDLLTEVEALLVEVEADGDVPATRLGPPARFAAELRASAGLPPAQVASEPAESGLAITLARLAATPAVRRTGAALRELAPLWWVARAYVAAALVILATGPEGTYAERWTTGLALLAVALPISLALGLAGRHQRLPLRKLRIAVDVILLAVLIPVTSEVVSVVRNHQTIWAYVPAPAQPVPGLALDGKPLHNVYAYDRDGDPLYDVRLYDELGNPLDIDRGVASPDRRMVVAGDGEPLFNSFPIRYFEPHTRHVAQPGAAPEGLAPPPLTTAPLAAEPAATPEPTATPDRRRRP